jgi:hypothetical protein
MCMVASLFQIVFYHLYLVEIPHFQFDNVLVFVNIGIFVELTGWTRVNAIQGIRCVDSLTRRIYANFYRRQKGRVSKLLR